MGKLLSVVQSALFRLYVSLDAKNLNIICQNTGKELI
jgi:hypothetical protein